MGNSSSARTPSIEGGSEGPSPSFPTNFETIELMKKCTVCKNEQPLENFNKDRSRKDGLTCQCKTCCANRDKTFHTKNREHRLKLMRKRREQLRRLTDEYKSSRGCAFCSERTPCCLDLHHLNPEEKEDNAGDIMTWKAFLKEAEKCVVVCRNCHAKIHEGILSLPVA